MTNEQNELLKTMHLIKDYCENHHCEECCFARDDNFDYCPFKGTPCNDWDLKPLEENEGKFSVFK